VDGEILFDRELDLQRRGQVAKEREMLEKMDANKPGTASPPAPAPRRPAGYSREHEEREGGGN
jgi:hypothetical protein